MHLCMGTIAADNFNLQATLESGQLFRYESSSDWYYVITGSRFFRIRQKARLLEFEGTTPGFIKFFFALDEDYHAVLSHLSRDRVLSRAIKKYSGLRIMRQPVSDCVLGFLCSPAANIPKIKRNLDALAAMQGNQVRLNGVKAFTMPELSKLTNIELLRKAGTGFRAKYIKSAAMMNQDFSGLARLPYSEAKHKLTSMPGIGEKIADCILLFGARKLEAFPVDVWMRKVMMEEYFSGRPESNASIAEFGRERFGSYAGYAQQFLYHWVRNGKG